MENMKTLAIATLRQLQADGYELEVPLAAEAESLVAELRRLDGIIEAKERQVIYQLQQVRFQMAQAQSAQLHEMPEKVAAGNSVVDFETAPGKCDRALASRLTVGAPHQPRWLEQGLAVATRAYHAARTVYFIGIFVFAVLWRTSIYAISAGRALRLMTQRWYQGGGRAWLAAEMAPTVAVVRKLPDVLLWVAEWLIDSYDFWATHWPRIQRWVKRLLVWTDRGLSLAFQLT